VHDEVQMSVVPAEVDRMKMLLEAAAPEAGKYYNLRVPIGACADHGSSWQETH
jgi:DNA polymerase I-like protein with 3'-5' exonuclease and polymerase domains